MSTYTVEVVRDAEQTLFGDVLLTTSNLDEANKFADEVGGDYYYGVEVIDENGDVV